MKRKQTHKRVRPHTPVRPELKAVAVREDDAAAYTGFTVAFLRSARQGRTEGPPYVRAKRAVRYLLSDLDQWLASRRVAV